MLSATEPLNGSTTRYERPWWLCWWVVSYNVGSKLWIYVPRSPQNVYIDAISLLVHFKKRYRFVTAKFCLEINFRRKTYQK